MARKKSSSNNLLNAALYILVGVLLCVFKASVLNWAMTAIGAIMIVFGILKAVNGMMVEGVVMAAVGVVIIMGGWMFVDLILLILGIALILKGLLDLIRSIGNKKLVGVIASLITIAVGALLIYSKWALLDWLFIILGVVLIIDGILMAIGK